MLSEALKIRVTRKITKVVVFASFRPWKVKIVPRHSPNTQNYWPKRITRIKDQKEKPNLCPALQTVIKIHMTNPYPREVKVGTLTLDMNQPQSIKN